MYYVSNRIKCTVSSNGEKYVSTQFSENKNGLVAAFPCSWPPGPGRSPPSACQEPWAGGTPAARKCCYEPFYMLSRLSGKVI